NFVNWMAGVKTATSSVACAVTFVPAGSVPRAVAVLTMTGAADLRRETRTGRVQVNCQDSVVSSLPSWFVSPMLNPVGGTGEAAPHRSSVTVTLLSGVFPGLVTT